MTVEIPGPVLQDPKALVIGITDDAGLELQFAYCRASDSASNTGASDRYAWRMARFYFTISF